MDGVIADFELPNGQQDVTDWNIEGVCLNKRPIKTIIKKLKKLSKHNELYIFSCAPSKVWEDEKILWCKKYIPFVKGYFFFNKMEEKVDFFKQKDCSTYISKKAIVIEDTTETILNLRKIGVQSYHVISLII